MTGRESKRDVPPPGDGLNIDPAHADDVKYWCARLRCTRHQLGEAVAQVGPIPSNVEAYLRQRSQVLDGTMMPRGRRLS